MSTPALKNSIQDLGKSIAKNQLPLDHGTISVHSTIHDLAANHNFGSSNPSEKKKRKKEEKKQHTELINQNQEHTRLLHINTSTFNFGV